MIDFITGFCISIFLAVFGYCVGRAVGGAKLARAEQECRDMMYIRARTLKEAAEIEEKVVYGMDKGDPKGDTTVISAKKRDKEPLIFPYNENGPLAKCPKCGEICHVDVTGKYGYCVWCKRFKLEEK